MEIDDILIDKIIDKFTDKLAEKIADRIMKDGTFPSYPNAPAGVPNVVVMYACPPTDFKPMPYTTMSNATNKEE